MIKFFRADLCRLRKSPAFWLCLGGMLLICAGLMFMQATAMEYTVPLSRVIFLPLSLYGVGTAAFVSFFVGEEFGGGFIRNKLLAARCRGDCLLSLIAASCVGCILIYVVMTVFTGGLGAFFFENNVETSILLCYFLLGTGTSTALGCLFAVITLLCGNQAKGVLWCMAFAFGMLFLCLHTNSVLVQPEYKDGILRWFQQLFWQGGRSSPDRTFCEVTTMRKLLAGNFSRLWRSIFFLGYKIRGLLWNICCCSSSEYCF